MTGPRYRIGKMPASFDRRPKRNMKVFQTKKKYQKISRKWITSCAALPIIPKSFQFSCGAFGLAELPMSPLRSTKTMKTDKNMSRVIRMRNENIFFDSPPAETSPSAFIA